MKTDIAMIKDQDTDMVGGACKYPCSSKGVLPARFSILCIRGTSAYQLKKTLQIVYSRGGCDERIKESEHGQLVRT